MKIRIQLVSKLVVLLMAALFVLPAGLSQASAAAAASTVTAGVYYTPDNLSFIDTDLGEREIRGTLTWNLSSSGAGPTVRQVVYFVDFEDEIIPAPVSDDTPSLSGATYRLNIRVDKQVPENAKSLGVFTYIGETESVLDGSAFIYLNDADTNYDQDYREMLSAQIDPAAHFVNIRNLVAYVRNPNTEKDIDGSGGYGAEDVQYLLELIGPLFVELEPPV